jgi:H+/gluconate symporter-like permease
MLCVVEYYRIGEGMGPPVVVMGVSGSGKSTVGAALAQRLRVSFAGAGSLFFSHVNDAGFWLVNQYFRLPVGQTIKTWSIMETVLSVTGLVLVMLLSLVI